MELVGPLRTVLEHLSAIAASAPQPAFGTVAYTRVVGSLSRVHAGWRARILESRFYVLLRELFRTVFLYIHANEIHQFYCPLPLYYVHARWICAHHCSLWRRVLRATELSIGDRQLASGKSDTSIHNLLLVKSCACAPSLDSCVVIQRDNVAAITISCLQH